MIVLNIIQKDKVLCDKIADFVLKNKYALHVFVENIICSNIENKHVTLRLSFITKSLHFEGIEQVINKDFYSSDLIIYATPVSDVNSELFKSIRTEIKPT